MRGGTTAKVKFTFICDSSRTQYPCKHNTKMSLMYQVPVLNGTELSYWYTTIKICIVSFNIELYGDLYQCSSTVQNIDFNVPDPTEMAIIFPAGSMNGDQDCLTIPILDDDALEGDHSFSVSLNPPAPPVTLTTPSSSPVTITDNEGRGHAWACQIEK